MSRRSRRRSAAQSAPREKSSKGGKRHWPKAVGGGGLVLLVGGVITYGKVKSYLHSEAFRVMLEEKVGVVVGSDVAFTDFEWKGLHGTNDSCVVSSEGAIEKITITGLEYDVDTDWMEREVWELSDVKVRHVMGEMDFRKAFSTREEIEQEKHFLSEWLPELVELKDAEVSSVNGQFMTWVGDVELKDVPASIAYDGNFHRVMVAGGEVTSTIPFFPEMQIQSLAARYGYDRVTLDAAEIGVFDTGQLLLDGEYDLATQKFEINAKVNEVKCSDLIDEDWKKSLHGDVSGEFSVKPDASGDIGFEGSIEITDGELTALPVLDKIAKFTFVKDFKRVAFSKFTCGFSYRNGTLQLSDIYMRSNGLLRVEGDLAIRGRELDGIFRVGVPSGRLAHLPGAETKVFRQGREGLHWTSVRISGSLDDVKEDLSQRMIAAAGARMLEMLPEVGSEAIESGLEVIEGEALKKSVDEGKGLIDAGLDTGTGVINSGLNLLQGLGGDKKNDE